MLLAPFRFGSCQPYDGPEMCNAYYTVGTDYVYIPELRGKEQSQISNELDSALPDSTLALASEECQEKVLRVVCRYYFTPCGTETNTTVPVSVCPEECTSVSSSCPKLWDFMKNTLIEETDLQFIDCDNPSAVLQPLPHCCAGLAMSDCKLSAVKGIVCIGSKSMLLLMLYNFIYSHHNQLLRGQHVGSCHRGVRLMSGRCIGYLHCCGRLCGGYYEAKESSCPAIPT